MNKDLSIFSARLREFIGFCGDLSLTSLPADGLRAHFDAEFNALALVLFGLQHRYNPAYRKICEARGIHPDALTHWFQIPAVPTAAFKELDLTALAPADRTAVFHSSGTTEQKPSRHYHCPDSLATYETSLWANFEKHFQSSISNCQLISLTPPPAQAPRSSLVHMFEVVRTKLNQPPEAFLGCTDASGAWAIDFYAALRAFNSTLSTKHSTLVLGTAFSFVHLLDHLIEKDLKLTLPPGSRVMETGGYKNRSRTMPKAELHALITDRLGVPRENIICEYGMSELSSQAYDSASHAPSSILHPRPFHFPPWARARIVSPETGAEVPDGETGLLRLVDLANVYSVQAIQTEDLAVRRGDGFELLGRATQSEPRGCSLMTA